MGEKLITAPSYHKFMAKIHKNKLRLHGITVSIIVFLSVIAYLNCLPNQFVYDDVSTVVENRLIKDWGNLPALFTYDYFKHSGELTYRPAVTLSYFIDYALWHTNPMGYHIVNVLIHSLNAVLIYFLALQLFLQYNKCIGRHNRNPTHSTGFAFLTTILFAIHPIASEVVNAVSYREDLIATAFLLTSFIFFLLYRQRGAETSQGSVRKNAGFLCTAATASYFIALLSKESAFILPLLVFSFELQFRAGILSSACRTILKILLSPVFLGYTGISIIYLILRFFILHNPNEKIVYPGDSFFINILTTIKVLGRYISNIFLPLNLNADYHVLYLKTPLALSFAIPFFVLISVIIISLRLWKKGGARPFNSFQHGAFISSDVRPPSHLFTNNTKKNIYKAFYRRHAMTLFSILWFFISMLPVMNIIPLANIMADRYLYMPIVGLCLLLSNMLIRLSISIKYPVIISLLIFYTFITVTRNNIWRDEFTLWYNASQSPLCSFTTFNNLGTQYNKKGYPDAALWCYQKALQKAREVGFAQGAAMYYNMGNIYEKRNQTQLTVSAYQKAIQIKPDYQQAHNNLGKVYFTLGQYDDAIAEYNAALKIDPDFSYAYNNLGVLYNKLGRQDDALIMYKKALSSDPQYGDAYYNMGNIYEVRMLYDLALEAYQNAIKIDPTQAYVHNNLGNIYDKMGFLEKAIEEYKYAISLDPAYPYSYNNLGAVLTKKGELDGAFEGFQKAAALLPDQPDFHFNLGYTYLQKGDLDNAWKEFNIALKISPSHAESLFYIGTIHHKQGRKEEARKLWQAVLEINPNHVRAKKCLEMIAE